MLIETPMDASAQTAHALFTYSHSTGVIATFVSIIAYLFQANNPELLLIIFIMMIIDTVTGMTAAYKEKQPITSRRMFNLLVKIVFYYGSIMMMSLISRSVAITNPTLTPMMVTFQQAVVFWVLGIEVKSNIENLSRLGALPAWIKRKVDAIFNQEKMIERSIVAKRFNLQVVEDNEEK